MGEIGRPPFWYFVIEAAKALNCTFMELFEHPERDQLISIAFSYKQGVSDGEFLLRCNPTFKREAKQRWAQTEIK